MTDWAMVVARCSVGHNAMATAAMPSPKATLKDTHTSVLCAVCRGGGGR